MEYRYTAIILKKKEIGETDRLYTVYTKEAGKLSLVAKGVRKPEAKLASQLETFNAVSLSVQKGKGRGNISGAIAEESFSNIRKHPETIFSILKTIGSVEKQVGFEERDEYLFSLLEKFLLLANTMSVSRPEKIPLLVEAFLVQFLDHLGYRIEANVCAASGERLSETDRLFFSPSAGGVVSSIHSKNGAQAVPIGAPAVKLLRIFLANKLEHIGKISTDDRSLREVSLAVRRLFEWIGK